MEKPYAVNYPFVSLEISIGGKIGRGTNLLRRSVLPSRPIEIAPTNQSSPGRDNVQDATIDGVSYERDEDINGWKIAIRGQPEPFYIREENLDVMGKSLEEYLEWLVTQCRAAQLVILRLSSP
jgi:hypothetical protein